MTAAASRLTRWTASARRLKQEYDAANKALSDWRFEVEKRRATVVQWGKRIATIDAQRRHDAALHQRRRGFAGEAVERRAEERLEPAFGVQARLQGPVDRPQQHGTYPVRRRAGGHRGGPAI